MQVSYILCQLVMLTLVMLKIQITFGLDIKEGESLVKFH